MRDFTNLAGLNPNFQQRIKWEMEEECERITLLIDSGHRRCFGKRSQAGKNCV
jgi:hypothetical protein